MKQPPPPLFQYWHDEDIPEDVGQLLELTRQRNPDLHYMLFDEESAAAFIEKHFSPREVAAFGACGPPAMQADYFRYCAVYALGGVYCDADMRCLVPFNGLLDSGGTLFERFSVGVVTNCLFGFAEPEHPLLGFALDTATAAIESRLKAGVSTVTGPTIFTALTLVWKLDFDGTTDLVRNLDGFPIHLEGFLAQLQSIRTIVGDYTSIAEAFTDVRVLPHSEVSKLIGFSEQPLQYRDTKNHYPSWKDDIYR